MAAAPAIRTRITSLFGCKYPLVLPGMSWISDPTLVAAVSNAGNYTLCARAISSQTLFAHYRFHISKSYLLCLFYATHSNNITGGVGILATGPLNADETRNAIRTIRSKTDKPFGIGATLLMPGATENAQVAIDEQVPIVNISLGKGDWIAKRVHEYNGKILATVTNAKHAQSAIDSGADALLLTGHEAAAHGGDVTSLVLIPCISKRFPDIPIVAAGGFADGRTLSAAIALGADAVAMGSRFATTQESSLAHRMKEIIANPDLYGGSTESDTLYGKNFDGIPARVLKSDESSRLYRKPASLPLVIYRAFNAAKTMNIPLYKVLPGLITQFDKMYMVAQFGAATESLMKATVDGNYDEGVQFIGQCQGLIQDIPAVDELVQRIMLEAIETSSQTFETFSGKIG
jgi:enoyl-[acyl-carrier protein] reductase II